MKTKAVVVHGYGDAACLQWQEITLPACGQHEVLITTKAVGFNMIDTYFRKGLYPAELPFVVGAESVGVITHIGASVTGFHIGERVACIQPMCGAYATERIIPQQNLIKIPDSISDELAAACLLKAMTAQCLLKQCYKLQASDTVVVYAAAGGVGSVLLQWAKHLQATVIAITGNAEKCAQAKAHGADYTVNMSDVALDEIAHRVKTYNHGKGVSVVYDSLGKDTFYASLDCLQPRGVMVSYGNATGAVENVDLVELARRGSLFVTRPMVFTYVNTQTQLQAVADEVFDAINKGIINIHIGQRYKMHEAEQAHTAAESRLTQGSTILLP